MNQAPEQNDYQLLDFEQSRPSWAQIRLDLKTHLAAYGAAVVIFAILIKIKG